MPAANGRFACISGVLSILEHNPRVIGGKSSQYHVNLTEGGKTVECSGNQRSRQTFGGPLDELHSQPQFRWHHPGPGFGLLQQQIVDPFLPQSSVVRGQRWDCDNEHAQVTLRRSMVQLVGTSFPQSSSNIAKGHV
jgi:hypothetical protein